MTDDREEANRRLLLHLRDRVEELEAENQRLRDRLAELEQVVDPDPGRMTWEEMTPGQKVQKLRVALAKDAAKQGGTARMTYSDVLWLFDQNPSAGHAYNLMERAAELDGYALDDSTDQKRITVKLDAVNDDAVIHSVNKAIEETPA